MKAADARIVLTGATGGIGHEAARVLLEAGASVMLAGRSSARLATQARALAQQTGVSESRVIWFSADLTQGAELQELATAAANWRCNLIVHNAGLPSFGRLETVPAAEMQAVLQTNLLAPMLLTQLLLPHLRRQAQAQVICVGSALGRIGLPGYSVYSASKFGLRGFAESLRRELAGTPVRVQYLGPRSTLTDFNDDRVQAYNQATGTQADTTAVVAQALLDMVESGQAERFLGFPEKLAVRLNGFAGDWMDGSFKRHRDSLPHDTTPVATKPSTHSLDHQEGQTP